MAFTGVMPAVDLVAPRYIRRGLFIDCLGGDDGAGSLANLGRTRHGSNRVRHSGRRLVRQPLARAHAALRIGRRQALAPDQGSDHKQIENIGTDARSEGRRVVAEVIVE